MQMNMVRYAGVELTMNKFLVAVRGKPKLNTKSLSKSELIGVIDMMSSMLWICNFLLEQGEGIKVDLLLGNNSPSPEEQGGKAPSLKKAMYFNVRLINITMGNKCSVNPMVCKWLLLKVTCEGVVSKCCIKEFGAIIKIEVSRTTGLCWGLYSVGYCSSSVVHTWPLQVGQIRNLAYHGDRSFILACQCKQTVNEVVPKCEWVSHKCEWVSHIVITYFPGADHSGSLINLFV